MRQDTRPAITHVSDKVGRRRMLFGWILVGGFIVLLLMISAPSLVYLEEPPLPQGNVSICGSCPSGYALFSVSADPAQCGTDQTLAHCIPLGAPLLSVCGACPEGYVRVGISYQPARCGNAEAGNMSQCQLQNLQGGIMGSGQGGVFCPPDCAGPMASPGTKTPPPVFCPPNCVVPGQAPPPPVYK
jgi:hypothetical protein